MTCGEHASDWCDGTCEGDDAFDGPVLCVGHDDGETVATTSMRGIAGPVPACDECAEADKAATACIYADENCDEDAVTERFDISGGDDRFEYLCPHHLKDVKKKIADFAAWESRGDYERDTRKDRP